MLLGKEDAKFIDTDTLITNIQKRVWGSLKRGYEYSGAVEESDEFLRSHIFSRVEMAVLYVDLVGSTNMTLELPEEKIAIIISSFAQEMAYVIRQYGGYVLKFVGDAVIGFFIGSGNSLKAADNVILCAQSMITAINRGINPILNQYDYPDLKVKIGIDYGEALPVRYGADKKQAPVDLLGPVMNIAAKIQSLAKPNQVLIGVDVFNRLHPDGQKTFREISWKDDEWKYRSRTTGKIYQVFEHVG